MYRKLLYITTTFAFILMASFSTILAQEKLILDEKDQRKLDYFFYEAMTAKAKGELDANFDLLKYCQQLDSTNANVLYELAIYYGAAGLKDQSRNLYEKAAAYDPDNFYYRTSYARSLIDNKENKEAIAQYLLLIKQFPDRPQLYALLSNTYLADDDIPKAIKALDKYEQIEGMSEELSLQKFRLYHAIKQDKKAFAEIQKQVDKNPNEIRYRIFLGNLYLEANNPDKALEMYNIAKGMDSENPYLISSMAEYYEAIGYKEAAEAELRKALLSPKMEVETKLNILTQYISTLQQNKQDIKNANPLFETLMEQHPQEPQLNLMYGNLLLIEEKKSEAYEQFEIFAETNPANPLGWEQMLATTLPDSIDMAIDVCQRALVHLPKEAQFYFYLGVGKAIKEEYDESLKVLIDGLEHAKDNRRLISDYYGQMGDVYHKTNQVDSAFTYYEKALRYNPNNYGILNNYSYFLAVEGRDLDKAEKMSSLTIKSDPNSTTYLDTYGWVLFMQGEFLMAKIYIEKALKRTIENKEDVSAEVLEHYGDALFKTGEEEKALEYWTKAFEEIQAKNKKNEILKRKIETKNYIEPKTKNEKDL